VDTQVHRRILFVMNSNLSNYYLYLGPGEVFKGNVRRYDIADSAPSNRTPTEETCLDELARRLIWCIVDQQWYSFPDKGTILGGRTSFIKHIDRLVEHWVNRFADSNFGISFQKSGILRDPQGNLVKLDCLRLNKYVFYSKGQQYFATGNLPITIAPVLESYLNASRFKRFLAKFFPRMMETKRNTFKTVWSMRFRLWISPDTYYEQEIIKFDAVGKIIAPTMISEAKKKVLQNEHRRKLTRIIGHEGCIRISKVDQAR